MDLLLTPSKVMGTVYLANTLYPFKLLIKSKNANHRLLNNTDIVVLDENLMTILESGQSYTIQKAQVIHGPSDSQEFFTLKRKTKIHDLKKVKSAVSIQQQYIRKLNADESTSLLNCLKTSPLCGHLYLNLAQKVMISLKFSNNVLRLYYIGSKEPFDAYPLNSNALALVDQDNSLVFRLVFAKVTITFEALTKHQALMWVALLNTSCLYLSILEDNFPINTQVLETTFKASQVHSDPIYNTSRDIELEILHKQLDLYALPSVKELKAYRKDSPMGYDFFNFVASPSDITTPVDVTFALEKLVVTRPTSEIGLSKLTMIIDTPQEQTPQDLLKQKYKHLKTEEMDQLMKILEFPDERPLSPIIYSETFEDVPLSTKPGKIDDMGRPNVIYNVENKCTKISFCSFTILIELIANIDSSTDEKWLWLCFLCIPLYSTPMKVFKQLLSRYSIELELRVYRAILYWYEWFPEDFDSNEMNYVISWLQDNPHPIAFKLLYIFSKKVI